MWQLHYSNNFSKKKKKKKRWLCSKVCFVQLNLAKKKVKSFSFLVWFLKSGGTSSRKIIIIHSCLPRAHRRGFIYKKNYYASTRRLDKEN